MEWLLIIGAFNYPVMCTLLILFVLEGKHHRIGFSIGMFLISILISYACMLKGTGIDPRTLALCYFVVFGFVLGAGLFTVYHVYKSETSPNNNIRNFKNAYEITNFDSVTHQKFDEYVEKNLQLSMEGMGAFVVGWPVIMVWGMFK